MVQPVQEKAEYKMKRLSLEAGFTLTELLVVVAIISILASIALPNFRQAHTKAMITRAQVDMRTIELALEAYHLDSNAYPPWTQNRVEGVDDRHPNQIRFYRLTTPVSYLSSIPVDPFSTRTNAEDWERWGFGYDYVDAFDRKNGIIDPDAWGHVWRINSWGPDRTNGYAGRYVGCVRGVPVFIYNSSNGVISNGDILRVGARGGPFASLYCPIQHRD
jgi:type II secretion system protein G